MFHVQTEDSGQGYARLHTHLFYEGTILSWKKQEYDPERPRRRGARADAAAAQGDDQGADARRARRAHRRVLHRARRAADARRQRRAAARAGGRGPAPRRCPHPPWSTAVAQARPELPPARARSVAGDRADGAAAPAKPVVMVKPGGVRRPPVVLSSSADGVVVRRNVVINVGGGAPPGQRHTRQRAPVAVDRQQRLEPRRARRRRSPPATAPSFPQSGRQRSRRGAARIGTSAAGVVARHPHAVGDARAVARPSGRNQSSPTSRPHPDGARSR